MINNKQEISNPENLIYFKFYMEIQEKEKKETLFEKFLFSFIPKANPDFDHKIPLVSEWLIEYNNSYHYVNREIGKNQQGEIIVLLPDDKNMGYWSDNNLNIDDFKNHFELIKLAKVEFSTLWKNKKN